MSDLTAWPELQGAVSNAFGYLAEKSEAEKWVAARARQNADQGRTPGMMDGGEFGREFPNLDFSRSGLRKRLSRETRYYVDANMLMRTPGIGQARDFAGEIPEEDRDRFKQILSEVGQDYQTVETHAEKADVRGLRALGDMAISTMSFGREYLGIGSEQGKKDLRYAQELNDIGKATEPAAGRNWLEKGELGAVSMAPALLASLLASRVGGPMAGAAGFSVVGGEMTAATAFWVSQEVPELKKDLRGLGFSEEESHWAGLAAGVPIAAVEALQVSHLVPKSAQKGIKDTAIRSVRQWAIETGQTYGKELGEEALQEGIAFGTKAILDYYDENVSLDYRQQWEQSKAGLAEAALTIPWLMGAGAASDFASIDKYASTPGTTPYGPETAPVVEPRPITDLSPESATSFAAENPEAAQNIIQSRPGKKIFENVGLPTGRNRAERDHFRKLVKEAASKQPAPLVVPPDQQNLPGDRPSESQGEPLTPPDVERTESPIRHQDVLAAFPGSKARKKPGEDAWLVEIGGNFTEVRVVDEIAINNWAEVEQSLGRKVGEKERGRLEAVGRFRLKAEDGTEIDGAGLIEIQRKLGRTHTVRHEALHLARANGLFKSDEWAALVEEYSDPIADFMRQEEDIAVAREAWKGPEGLREKIKAWINQILSAFGFEKLNAKTVQGLVESPNFWARKANKQSGGRLSLGDKYQLTSNNVANFVEQPEARELVEQVDANRKDLGLPKPVGDEQRNAEADALLKADRIGLRGRLVAAATVGEQFNAVETIAAKRLIGEEAAEALQSGDSKKLASAITLINAYREIRSEAGRTLRAGHDPVETPPQRARRSLLESMLDPPKKIKEQISKARAVGTKEGEAKALKLLADWVKKVDAMKAELLKQGIDLSNLDAIAKDPAAALKVHRALSAMRSDWSTAAKEYWRNSILSGFQTQAVNFKGNAFNAGLHYVVERPIEALFINLLPESARPKDAASFAEYKHIIAGLRPGVARGIRNAFLSFETEKAEFANEIGRLPKYRVETSSTAISDKRGGRLIRLPQRAMLAVDQLFQSIIGEMEIGSQAYRLGKSQGLKGEALRDFIAEQTVDIESESWDNAYGKALELSFQQEGSVVARKIKKFAYTGRKIPGGFYIAPFVDTPVNIIDAGIRKSPFGSIALIGRLYTAHETGDYSGISKAAAEQFLAWSIVALLAFTNDEDDPWITGAEPAMNTKDRQQGERTFDPMSIKIGGKWFSYARVEPFATTMGLTVDLVNAGKSGRPSRWLTSPFTSLVGQVKSKTFLQGISEMYRAVEPDKGLDGILRWGSSFASSWVPNLFRQTSRGFDEAKPERRVWGKGSPRLKRLGRRTLQRTELPFVKDEASYDIWGRARSSGDGVLPGTDTVWRILSPIRTSDEDIVDADLALIHWNLQNPDDEVFLSNPMTSIVDRGKRIHLTDEQFAFLSRVGGRIGRKFVDRLNFDSDKPTRREIDRIKKRFLDGRAIARRRLKAAIRNGDSLAGMEQRLTESFDL